MKNSKEVILQRQERILQLIQQKQMMSVAELVKHFHVTPATIRRDLEDLEEQGNVKRFFGGVEYILPPCIRAPGVIAKGGAADFFNSLAAALAL